MALYPEGTAPLPLDDVQRAANKANELSRQALGQNGFIVSDSSIEGNFIAIQCLDNVAFDALIAVNSDTSLLTTGYAVPAGTVLYGQFSNIASNGGIYVAYKA
jgi:hypothetical protein